MYVWCVEQSDYSYWGLSFNSTEIIYVLKFLYDYNDYSQKHIPKRRLSDYAKKALWFDNGKYGANLLFER